MKDFISSVQTAMDTPVGLLIISLIIGAFLALVFTVLNRTLGGAFIKALIRDGADTPERARTLAELRLERSFAVRLALRRKKGLLRRLSRTVEESACEAPSGTTDGKTDIRALHFYLPAETREKAEALYGGRSNPVLAVLAFLLLAAVLYLLIRLIPNIIEFASAMIGF